jgi:putative methionine-R-sulfoxide reductase with GAF domain
MQKLISEDDGGEDITAGRTEWSGIYFPTKNELTKGVHTGTFMGIPATGKHVCVRMATFDRVVDGKIVSSEVIMDVAGLLIQLGVMPPPTSL